VSLGLKQQNASAADNGPELVELITELHAWLADADTQLIFLTDVDGTIVEKPGAKEDDINVILAAHLSDEGVAAHQIDREDKNTILQLISDLKNNRSHAPNFFGIITASGFDRFINTLGLLHFQEWYSNYEELANSPFLVDFTNPDVVAKFLGHDSKTDKAIFDIVSAGFDKFEITYEVTIGIDGKEEILPIVRFIDDDGNGVSALAEQSRIFLEKLNPIQFANSIAVAWSNSLRSGVDFFGQDSEIGKEVARVLVDFSLLNKYGPKELVSRVVLRFTEFRPDSLCLHGFTMSCPGRNAAIRYLKDKNRKLVEAKANTTFYESDSDHLLAVNTNVKTADPKIAPKTAAYERILEKHIPDHEGKRLIVYIGDTGSDAALMKDLQVKYKDDNSVKVFCVGVGNESIFKDCADVIVPDIDNLASLISSMSKFGTLPESRDGWLDWHAMFSPEAVDYSSKNLVNKARAEQLVAGSDIAITPAGLKKITSKTPKPNIWALKAEAMAAKRSLGQGR